MTLQEARRRVARPWRGVSRLSGRTALRTKLITALLALVIVALAAISLSSSLVLRSYLTEQFDSQLQSAFAGVVNAEFAFEPGALVTVHPTTVYIVAGVEQPGTLLHWPSEQPGGVGSGGNGQTQSLPAVPTSPAWADAHSGKPVTVSAQSGNDSWRVIAAPISYQSTTATGTTKITGTLVVATNLGDINATISRLAAADLIVGAIIVCILTLAVVVVVRSNLRPLVDIEETAGEIAAGHLNRRVPERDPRTEIGSLGQSLNTMLSQIETAFHAREASEAAAHQSEERMRRFVADASHELRTPLTAIRGFAEYYRQRGGLVPHWDKTLAADTGEVDRSDVARAVLGAGLTPDDLDRIMQRVESEAARMGLLVEDLLLLARLDQQRPLSRQPIDLLSLAADAVHDTRMLAPDRTISLSVQPGAAFLITGDEPRLRQVIGNLMSNALTHTPDGTPIEVAISSGTLDPRADEPAPAVILDVTDHGPGMTPDQARRVFERFYRADQARTRTKGGSGLGLAIVSALVAAHGGVASVRTAPDRGATFRVTLPLAPEAQGGLPPDEDDEEFGEPAEPVTGDEANDLSVTYGTAVGSGGRETDESGTEYASGDAEFTGLPQLLVCCSDRSCGG
ncbi:MAG: HAMP domain-containing histidine kinase [Actinomycetota bacterium]|nr:HAMP domain-containing histidine kinase [Actinomycetota bacterium]